MNGVAFSRQLKKTQHKVQVHKTRLQSIITKNKLMIREQFVISYVNPASTVLIVEDTRAVVSV